MKYLFVFLFALLLGACTNSGGNNKLPVNDTSGNAANKTPPGLPADSSDSVLHKKITDTLMKLSFVRESNRYLDSLSNHTRGLSFMFDTSGNHIDVVAGYSGTDRFETYYNFTINSKTLVIRIMDPLGGKLISIEEYIKKNKE